MAGWSVGLVGLVGRQAGLCELVGWFGWLAGWRVGSVKLVLIISFHYLSFFFFFDLVPLLLIHHDHIHLLHCSRYCRC